MIRLYDTESRTKRELETLQPGKIKMYVCGPTVYDSCHVGHARPAVVFDTIRRYLEYSGYAVQFISNITDIDDKIIRRANELGISCSALTSRYQDEYERDMTALGVRSPTIRPKATEHISEMIDLISGLIEKGFAYVNPRGVWFDVSKFANYGRMSGRRADDENTEHRVEEDSDKRNAQDFALWKSAKPGEPKWASPWGDGRPGWHIECSAMAGKYCDFQLDIHSGGADLQFPHHENEIAQSEAFSGKQFVRYWLHNGFITVGRDDGEEDKMGKSRGNAFWLREAFRNSSPLAVRLWILGTHYRMPLQYRVSLFESAENSLDRIYNCVDMLFRKLGDGGVGGAVNGEKSLFVNEIDATEKSFADAMNDDFNTPQALAAVYEFIAKANSNSGALKLGDAAMSYTHLLGWLGVLGLPAVRPEIGGADVDGFISLLIKLRAVARSEKNFAMSDKIRDGLTALNIELNDRGSETTWKKR